ncbi:MAG: DUF3305 domain-containing protein [Rhodopseudomonas sp.]|nr:DUF3305 domain-containing protein [Rhodopseudomonas sp.]
MSADAVMPVSVVLERRASKSPWVDHVWEPIGVLPRVALPAGAVMAEGEGFVQYHGGSLDLELFRGETEGYLNNLSQTPPLVYVVLRRDDGDAEIPENLEGLEFKPFLVTVCPYEGNGYAKGNDELVVAGVAMPLPIMAWVQEFVTAHHVDEPFVKRKNRRHQDNDQLPPVLARDGGLS